MEGLVVYGQCICVYIYLIAMKPFILITHVLLVVAVTMSFPQIQHKCWVWNSSCLTTQAQSITPHFVRGIPELGIRPLDPMFIDYVYIAQDGVNLNLWNIKLTGLKSVVIKRISIDMKSRVMRMVLITDYALNGQYSASGTLFNLPFYGSGDFSTEFSNVELDVVMPFDVIKDKYGRDVMDLKGYTYSFDLKGIGRYHFTNLYYGDKTAGDRMNTVLNQNAKYFTERYGRHIYDKATDQIFNAIRDYLRSLTLENITFY